MQHLVLDKKRMIEAVFGKDLLRLSVITACITQLILADILLIIALPEYFSWGGFFLTITIVTAAILGLICQKNGHFKKRSIILNWFLASIMLFNLIKLLQLVEPTRAYNYVGGYILITIGLLVACVTNGICIIFLQKNET